MAASVAIEEPVEDDAGALEFNLDAYTEEPAPTVAAEVPASGSEADQALEFDLGDLVSSQPVSEAVEEEAPVTEAEMGELEGDLDDLISPSDSETEETPAETIAEEMPDFSFDLPEAEPVSEAEAPASTEVEEESIDFGATPVPEEDHLDFNFNLEAESPDVTEEQASSLMPELDLSGISLDLEEPVASADMSEAAAGESGGSEVATKLDLARAYVEMGDKEGAKEILEEVLKEGSSQQQADANQLLASL
jgi:pilus assembly protein FimV